MKLFVGATGSGKTERMIRDILESTKKRKVMLVPEQFTFATEKRLAAASGVSGFLDITVMSMDLFFQRLLGMYAQQKQDIITPVGKHVLLRSIAHRVQPELKIFNDTQGIIEGLEKILPEFIHYQVTEVQDPFLQKKVEDVQYLISQYEEVLQEEGLIDQSIAMNNMSEQLAVLSWDPEMEIWIDNYEGFSESEYALIQAINEKTSVTMALSYEEKNYAYAHTEKTFQQLYKRLQPTVETICEYQENPYYKAVGDTLFGYGASLYDQKKKLRQSPIEILYAQTFYEEMEYVASRIIKLLREESYTFDDIAVVGAHVEEQKSIIARLFDRYDINYYFDIPHHMFENPLTHFINSLFEAILYPYKQDGIRGILKSGLIPMDEAFQADKICMERGVTPQRLVVYKMPQAQQSLWQEIDHMIHWFDSKEYWTLSEFSARMTALMQFVAMDQKMEQYMSHLKDNDALQIVAQLLPNFLALLDQMQMVCLGESFTLRQMYEMLCTGLASISLEDVPVASNSVIIGNIGKTVPRGVKALFIIGFAEGHIPQPISEGVIFNIDEMEQLNIEPLHYEYHRDKEIYNIYKMLLLPSEHLYLSFAATNKEGEEQRPSSLLNKLKRVSGITHKTFSQLEREERLTIATQKSTLLGALAYDDEALLDPSMVLQLKQAYHPQSEKYISKETAEKLFLERQNFSVTSLERASSCLYRHFIAYGLQPKEWRRFELTMDRYGSYLHTVMDRFVKYFSQKAWDWSRVTEAQVRKAMDAVLQQTEKQEEFTYSSKNKYISRKLDEQCYFLAQTIIHHINLGTMIPYSSEHRFEDHEIYPGAVVKGFIDRIDATQDGSYFRVVDYKTGTTHVSLPLIYNGLSLQLMTYYYEAQKLFSKNDRAVGVYYLETSDELSLGGHSLSWRQRMKMNGLEIDEPDRLQQSVTLDKTEQSDHITPLSLSVVSGEITAKKNKQLLMPKEFEQLSERTIQHIRQQIETIHQGDISVNPVMLSSTLTSCTYCPYKAICGFEEHSKAFAYRICKSIDEISREE